MASHEEDSTALGGVRVLDATQMLAGPLAGARLGDLGADVIKIEAPVTGEFNRTHGFDDIRVNGEMSTFLALNRNKRSLAVDLKTDEGRTIFHALCRSADVFLQNFRHGTAERLGAGYEELHALNPRLVYCSISGYGPSGPYRDRPGQDLVVQGYSGSMFSVGRRSDPPLPGALWAADVMSGYQALIGVLAALHARHHTGEGQHVQVDMLSTVLDSQLQELVTYLNTGRQPERTDEFSAHPFIPAPYGVYRTEDGWLTLAMTDLPRLGEVLDDDYLRSLTAYNDGSIHRDEIYGRIRNAFVASTTAQWIEKCDKQGVWCGPVYTYEDLDRDPHIIETGMFVEQPHGKGTIRTLRPPLSMSSTPPRIARGAPALGSDTRELLGHLGYDDEQIEALVENAVVGVSRD
ncbi:MAG: CaiB/BaiF CoA-transferase family protein [Acidimicrobiales bacterium]|jgi:crotonobetainyl-CoA:carnitine CoA-transferase CaiB-like acyl-CoA transferase